MLTAATCGPGPARVDTVNAAIGATLGVLVGAAILLAVLGIRGTSRTATVATRRSWRDEWVRLTHRPAGAAGRRRDLRWAAGGVSAVVAWAVTGLPVMVVAVPVVVIVLPWLLSNPNIDPIARTAAIDQWVRSLRSVLLSGADNTLEGALQSSLQTAPGPIAEPVRLLVARISARWPTDRALTAFADDLADPTGDVVAAALILAARRRGTGITEILEGLATAVADEVRARRRIEGERASTRAAARYLTLIFAAMGLGLAWLNPGYLDPYTTGSGQVILLATIGGFLLSLWVVRRVTTVSDRPRLWPGRDRAAESVQHAGGRDAAHG